MQKKIVFRFPDEGVAASALLGLMTPTRSSPFAGACGSRARSGSRSPSASSLCAVEADAVVLTVVSGASEAEVVCGLLRTAGIECAYRDTEEIDSPLEDFIAAGSQEILVYPVELEAAQELLAAQQG